MTLADWNVMVPLARSAGLLARLARLLIDAGRLEEVPKPARQHLLADHALADKHARDIRWEIGLIGGVLAPRGIPAVLLKGAAYLAAELPAAKGRLFADVDVLVPRAHLAETEAALCDAGWRPDPEMHPYDAQYYRRYMHQVPPLTHERRGTTVDLHHTIVPVTARLAVDPALLIAAAQPTAAGMLIPAPADLILHSAVHLFNEGRFDRALRDLDDITRLLNHFSIPHERLALRARELNLELPMRYALHYAARLLGAKQPESPAPALMDRLFLPLLEAPYRPLHGVESHLAGLALYVRSHSLRMPAHLLFPHLARKAWRRITEGPQSI